MASITGNVMDCLKKEQKVFRISVLALFLIYIWITFPNLGFARDDWNHYASIRNLYQTLGDGEALRQITTNQWFGAHELRIFFLSFFSHFLISKVAIAQQLIYLIQLSLHVAAASLLGSVVLNKLKSLKLALTLIVLLAFAPAASQNTFWINNLFFVQPWFFYSLVLWIAIVPKLPTIIRLGLVTSSALVCAFSGEGTIPLLIFTLAVLTYIWAKKAGSTWRVIQSLMPIAIVSCTLLAYVLFVMVRPPSSTPHFENILQFPKYLAQLAFQWQEISRFNSEYYGFSQMAPNLAVYAAALSVGFLLTFVYLRTKESNEFSKNLSNANLLLLGFFALVAALIPQLIGVLTGSRPGPELRYLYVPVQVALIVAVVSIWAILINSKTPLRRVVAVSSILLSVYSAGLTSYNSTVIWKEQGRIDDNIWTQLDKNAVSKKWGIVTFHPLHPYLMAPYHSNAVSDFQADWGIAGRLQWLHPDRPRVQVFRDAELNSKGELLLRNYYDDKQNCSISSASRIQKSVLFMIFDYGQTFKDLGNSPLLITSDYTQFEKMRNQMNKKYSTTQSLNNNDSVKACSN